MRVSRRRFLGGALAVAAAPAHASAVELDIAIVGGGIAGTYAAWWLAQRRPDLRVRLFEASPRIGGRLHSIAFSQAPDLVVEAGGMRFLEAHAHVFGLVKTLGLGMRGFPIDKDFDRVLLRGRNYSVGQVKNGGAAFSYRTSKADQGPDADDIDRAVGRAVPNAGHLSAADWHSRRARYLFLRNQSNRAFLGHTMSGEEIAFAMDASGFSDWIEAESGLDELDYYFSHDDESRLFFTIPGGYQRLPEQLAARAGPVISTHCRVASLRWQETAFRLGVVAGDGRTVAIGARKVILALPRRAIECIADFPETKRFTRLITSVRPIPACKTLVLYKRPWWRDHGISEGRSVTDLPARQLYVLGSEDDRSRADNPNGFGVLMAYSDMGSVDYWKKRNFRPDPSGFTPLAGETALVREVHRQAELVLGQTRCRPIEGRFQDWTVDPYGGGWHYFALGHDGAADGEAMLKPLRDRDLYVCGEAYSFDQGWAEGAIERTDTLLRRFFA